MRPGCLIAVGLVVLGAVLALAGSFVLTRGDGGVQLGRADDYAAGAVVYRSTDGLFVVRQTDGTVLALSDLDPHNPQGRTSCRVTFRPDLGGEEGGRFFDQCTRSTYDLGGRGLSGDGRDLERLELREDDGRLSVKRPAHVD